ncbi:MAG: hypothetical protein JWR11_1428 [Mycobacterium sp.]|nr:hypothetical protein [Mycobacterium sp.]
MVTSMRDLHPATAQDSTSDADADREPIPSSRSHWVPTAALVIALVAIGVAVWALTNSSAGPADKTAAPSVSAQQSDAAKERVCGAFAVVRNAVSVQTNADLGSDLVAREAVAANARLATLGGGEYLRSRVDPATPTQLADAARQFADDIQDIGMNQLIGIPNTDPKVASLLTAAQAGSDRIAQLCK